MVANSFFLVAAVPLIVAGLAGQALSDTVTLTASRDATLYEDAEGDRANGSGQYLFVGRTGQPQTRRALIAFAIDASIPGDATITMATLALNLSKTPASARTATLHRVLADWGEGSSNAAGQEGDGTTAATGDATWLHTFYDADVDQCRRRLRGRLQRQSLDQRCRSVHLEFGRHGHRRAGVARRSLDQLRLDDTRRRVGVEDGQALRQPPAPDGGQPAGARNREAAFVAIVGRRRGRGARRSSHRAPGRSTMPPPSRSNRPYLVMPPRLGRWLTGTDSTRPPPRCISAGKNRCM